MTPSHKLTYCLSYFLLLCLTASSLFKLLPLKMINCWSPPLGKQGGQVNQSCCHKREVGTQRGVVVEEAPHGPARFPEEALGNSLVVQWL